MKERLENENSLGKKWELVNFCEFDKYATASYCAIHNVDKSLNLGDITKVDESRLPHFTMMCGGSPCQDFSVAGKQKGSVWTCKDCGEIYNPLTVHWSERDKCPCCGSNNIEKTRSSLLVEYLRIIRSNKPSFGMYENVKNIVGKQFKDTTFKLFTNELEEYGYNVYWKVLNAKNYGIPQNRERVYLIFIKKDLDNGQFKFPEPFDNGIRLKDILEDAVDEKFYVSKEKTQKFLKTLYINKSDEGENSPKFVGNINRPDFGTGYAGGVWDTNNISPTLTTMQGGGRQPHIITSLVSNKGEKFEKETDVANTLLARDYKGFGNQAMNAVIESSNGKIAIRQATKKGYIECEIGGVADLSYPESKTRRGRVQEGGNICPTLTATETSVCKIESPIRIRKLTPRECFRLMGFSDEAFNAAEKVCSNSQLYKQSGNSIVVDVLYYILVELYKAMPYLFTDLRLGSFFSGIGAFEASLDRLYESINCGEFAPHILNKYGHGNNDITNICIDDTNTGFCDVKFLNGYAPTLRAQRSGLKVFVKENK